MCYMPLLITAAGSSNSHIILISQPLAGKVSMRLSVVQFAASITAAITLNGLGIRASYLNRLIQHTGYFFTDLATPAIHISITKLAIRWQIAPDRRSAAFV